MLRILNLLILMLFPWCVLLAALPNKVLIRLQLSSGISNSDIEIGEYEVFFQQKKPLTRPIYHPGLTNISSWELPADKPLGIYVKLKEGKSYKLLLEPGSDITLKVIGKEVQVSGPGSETFDIQYKDILPGFAALAAPNTKPAEPLRNLAEWDAWNAYLDKKSEIVQRAVDRYSAAHPSGIWNIIKTKYLSEIEYRRCERFLVTYANKEKYNLSQSDINSIYHTTVFNGNLQWLLDSEQESPAIDNYMRFISAAAEVAYPRSSPQNRYIYEPSAFRETYKLKLRLIDSLTSGRLKVQLTGHFLLTYLARVGSNDIANELLPVAFSMVKQPGDQEYIKKELAAYVKAYAPSKISEFYFLDINGKPVMRKDFTFKPLVLHVKSPAPFQPDSLFERVVREFRGNPGIVLAEVSYGMDFETWQQKNRDKDRGSGILLLYAPQTGDHLDFIANIYSVLNVPTLALYQYKVSHHKHITDAPAFGTTIRQTGNDTVSAILSVLRDEVNKYDGPYIRTIKDTAFLYRISSSRINLDTLSGGLPVSVEVQTGASIKPFVVKINSSPAVPPTWYPEPPKSLFLSDLEGNFDIFRDFLIRHQVIDTAYNWTYGKGHLIIGGDIFDRGRKVTACLWLIYELENKARDAGGAVHFILGNHEVMNLTNKLSYVYPDYIRFAGEFGLSYAQLYDQNSVLGKWLRSKNIMEIIGNNLVVHGGISPGINKLNLSAEEINNMHRCFLSGQSAAYKDTAALSVILSSAASPYWFRGYYPKNNDTPSSAAFIDQTLALYKVRKIITGHTIVNNISSFYGGKVINIDTHHASGDSEGLLIENGIFYRVDVNGLKEKMQ